MKKANPTQREQAIAIVLDYLGTTADKVFEIRTAPDQVVDKVWAVRVKKTPKARKTQDFLVTIKEGAETSFEQVDDVEFLPKGVWPPRTLH